MDTTVQFNLEDVSFYPDTDGPSFLEIVRPRSPPDQRYTARLMGKVNALIRTYDTKADSKLDILHFLVAFRHLLIYSNGVTERDEKQAGAFGVQQLTTGAENDICFFLGTKVSGMVGCKGGESSKLTEFLTAMELILLSYLQHLPESLLAEFDTDEEVFMQFTQAITTLVYFYGRKSMSSPSHAFSPFFTALNTLFGREIIRVTCEDPDKYMCGRGITYAKCTKTNRFFLVIDQTQSESNNSPSYTMNARAQTVANACGGRRRLTKRRLIKRRRTRRKRTIRR